MSWSLTSGLTALLEYRSAKELTHESMLTGVRLRALGLGRRPAKVLPRKSNIYRKSEGQAGPPAGTKAGEALEGEAALLPRRPPH